MTSETDVSPPAPPGPPPTRLILAIDTALGACSVAVHEAGGATLARRAVAMDKGHAEALMPMLEAVMADSGVGFRALERVAVTVGPGSFTGLRIGIAAARAIGLAAEIPVVGVTTLAAYAAPLISADQAAIVAVAVDARHGAVFLQTFAPGGRTLIAPRVLKAREAARAIGAGPVMIVGSAATALAVEAMALGLRATIADLSPAPDIIAVARLGLSADPQQAPARPLYLRPPGATPQDAAGIARR